MADVRLQGCRLEPLASYLKALGVLRLVGEQVDPEAVGWWEGGRFVLRSSLDRDQLVGFFLDDYCPTPIVTPWNKGSGFGAEDAAKSPAAVAALDRIEQSRTPRLDQFRETVAATKRLVASTQWQTTLAAKDAKPLLVTLARNALPDAAVRWIDGSVVLASGKEQYPPLFGTGGNVGRLDFSKAYFDAVADVVDPGAMPAAQVSALLVSSILGEGSPRLGGGVIGQFDPGGAGGVNSGPFGDAGSLVNPWDYVLNFEGGLLFAGSASRRMGSEGGRAAVPFMVRSSPVGYATSADAEDAKGELWAPVWSAPTSAAGLERFISEGRTTWNGRQATNGLEASFAIASLGVDRGVDEFVRHAFVVRHGQNALAVPVGRFVAGSRREVPVLGALDRWLHRVRRIGTKPASLSVPLRRAEESMIQVAAGGGATALQDVLMAAARVERAVARSRGLREDVGISLNGLSAEKWIGPLDDGSVEFRLAVAFASQHDPFSVRLRSQSGRGSESPALYLRSVDLRPDPRRDAVDADAGLSFQWSGRAPRVVGLDRRPILDVLAEFLVVRGIDAQRATGRREIGQVGVQSAFAGAPVHPSIHALTTLTNGEIDFDRMGGLIDALLLLDWSALGTVAVVEQERAAFVHPALALLAPFFVGHPVAGWVDRDGSSRNLERVAVDLRPEAQWFRLLANRSRRGTEQVVESALRRLRIAGLSPAIGRAESISAGIDPLRLAAGLTMPISGSVAEQFLRQTLAIS